MALAKTFLTHFLSHLNIYGDIFETRYIEAHPYIYIYIYMYIYIYIMKTHTICFGELMSIHAKMALVNRKQK